MSSCHLVTISTHQLFSGPEGFRLHDSRRQSFDPCPARVSVLGPQSTIDDLEVLISSEICRFVTHPHTGHYVILDQTSKGSTRCWDKVLIVCVCDHHCFGASYLVFCLSTCASVDDLEEDVRGKWMFISSPSKSAL